MILLRCYARIPDLIYSWTNGLLDLRILPIYSYGFMVACGFLAAAVVVTRELKRREALGLMPALGEKKDGTTEWTSDLVGDLVIICAIFGVLGSCFFNYLESPDSYKDFWQHPVESLFSGLSVYGGMICAGLALLGFSLYKKVKIPHMFDSLAYCFILAVGIGRLGCQLSGDGDWGIENLAPKPDLVPQWLWSTHYAHNIVNEGVYISGCTEEHCMQLANPVYPTPMYEFFECTAIFLLLHFMRKKLTAQPGMLFFVFSIGIGLQRYSIEQIRAVSDRDLYQIFGAHLKQAEIISIAMVIIGVIGVAFLEIYYRKHPAQGPAHA
ncbi:MAG: prolipoprotein diacylglyceryl transferase family protein [Chitinophagales bacterium]